MASAKAVEDPAEQQAEPSRPDSPRQKQSEEADEGLENAEPTSASDKDASEPSSPESGEASPVEPTESADQHTPSDPPLPKEEPPLPKEGPPAEEDDGWEFHWDASHQAYYFFNRFTQQATWENPRVSKGEPAAAGASSSAGPSTAAEPPKDERPPAGGYNPAIHGDYDPNAWYAQKQPDEGGEQETTVMDSATAYAAIGTFNRFTGRFQRDEQNPDQHSDEAKSRRQMNAFFDVDAAANSHDGRSLKAERSGKKPTKAELKQFKEKRRVRKEEKRRAWLRD